MVGGWAFVHRGQIVGMLAGMFRAKLNKALVLLARKWPSFARVEKDRLLPIVAQLTADRSVPHCSTSALVTTAIGMRVDIDGARARAFFFCFVLDDSLRTPWTTRLCL